MIRIVTTGIACLVVAASSAQAQVTAVDLPPVAVTPGLTTEDLASRVRQFAPVELTFDAELLDSDERIVVRKLVEASEILNEIFRLQVWRENLEYGAALESAEGAGLDVAREYYDIRLSHRTTRSSNEAARVSSRSRTTRHTRIGFGERRRSSAKRPSTRPIRRSRTSSPSEPNPF